MAKGDLAPLWDAHVHLASYPDPGSVVSSASSRGTRLMTSTVAPREAALNLEIRGAAPGFVRCFIGVHPSEAASLTEGLGPLQALWEDADGVGEVGLDPKYSDASPGGAQARLFEAQVDVAERLGKPLQVHSRGAEEACLDVLDARTLGRVLLHWFEGEGTVERVLSRKGRFVSFGPAVLYSKKLSRLACRFPPDSVLAESDGPVSFAALGDVGGPGMIPSVVFKLAELWGKRFEDVVLQLSENAEEYLG